MEQTKKTNPATISLMSPKEMRRISRILSFLVLFAVGLLFVGSPEDFSAQSAQQNDRFDVAVIKPTSFSNGSYKIQFTDDGFTARNVSLLMMIEEAFGVFDAYRIVGIPKLLKSAHYDVDAKFDTSSPENLRHLSLVQRRAMLKHLLEDRFHLKTVSGLRMVPVYELRIDKKGLKINADTEPAADTQNGKAAPGLVTQQRPGTLAVRDMPMDSIAQVLIPLVDRPVVNRTGLAGRYDFTLNWSPTDNAKSEMNAVPTGPSLFSALPEQLGLKLLPGKSPLETVTVVQADAPTEN